MKIKQICLILSIITLSYQHNLRQGNTTSVQSNSTIYDIDKAIVNDPAPTNNVNSANVLPLMPAPTVTQQNGTNTNHSNIPTLTKPVTQEINSQPATKPTFDLNSNLTQRPNITNNAGVNVLSNIGNDVRIIKPLSQPEIYKQSIMLPSKPLCFTPAPIATPIMTAPPQHVISSPPMISTPIMISPPIAQPTVRPNSRALPPTEIFAPEHRILGPPVSQPSPLIEAVGLPPVHRLAPIPSIPIQPRIPAITQARMAPLVDTNSITHPLNEKDIKITVNKKRRGKIELTISANPKENNI